MYDSLIDQSSYFNPINTNPIYSIIDSITTTTTTSIGINNTSTTTEPQYLNSDQIMNCDNNSKITNLQMASCSFTSASSNDHTIATRKRKKKSNNKINSMEIDHQQRPAKSSKRMINSQTYNNNNSIDVNQINLDAAEMTNQNSRRSRSSKYRGVTRHRWTGRYEAHLWDKESWNVSHSKKGKQVYLGAYDEEEAAARAYDLAALKYWGLQTMLNFPLTTYSFEVEEMKRVSREEYIASLRRNSNGFSRGVSKYRGVARHHHNGRWEARIGRVFGNKYLYLGTYSTEEEAAIAYDIAAIEHRGVHAVTNFDISNYVSLLGSKLKPPFMMNTSIHNIHSLDPFRDCYEPQQDQNQKNINTNICYANMITQLNTILNAYGSNSTHDECSAIGAPNLHIDARHNHVPQIDYSMDYLKSTPLNSSITNVFFNEGDGHEQFSTHKEIKNPMLDCDVGPSQNICPTQIQLKDEHQSNFNIHHQLQCEGLIIGSQFQGFGEIISDTSTSSSSASTTSQVSNNYEIQDFITRKSEHIHTIKDNQYMTDVIQPMLHTSCFFDESSNLMYSSIYSSNNITLSGNVAVLVESPMKYDCNVNGDLMVSNKFNHHDFCMLPPLNMQQ